MAENLVARRMKLRATAKKRMLAIGCRSKWRRAVNSCPCVRYFSGNWYNRGKKKKQNKLEKNIKTSFFLFFLCKNWENFWRDWTQFVFRPKPVRLEIASKPINGSIKKSIFVGSDGNRCGNISVNQSPTCRVIPFSRPSIRKKQETTNEIATRPLFSVFVYLIFLRWKKNCFQGKRKDDRSFIFPHSTNIQTVCRVLV